MWKGVTIYIAIIMFMLLMVYVWIIGLAGLKEYEADSCVITTGNEECHD